MSVLTQQLPAGGPGKSSVWLVSVGGRLDQNLTPELETTLTSLLDEGHNDFIVDLSETTYINSGGLRCLVSAWRRARANNGSVSLCGLNERLQEIFTMIGFDKVFQIHPDCADVRPVTKPGR
jgi:anti-sigma B factor antagonist